MSIKVENSLIRVEVRAFGYRDLFNPLEGGYMSQTVVRGLPNICHLETVEQKEGRWIAHHCDIP